MSALREPPRGPDNEPVRPLVHQDCHVCAGDGWIETGTDPWSNHSRGHRCSFCAGRGYYLRELLEHERKDSQ